MGQFDLETDAALAQLDFEEISKTPGGEFAEIIGDLLMLIGTGGLCSAAGGASNLLRKIRGLAGASYASNLIYVITAVRDDLADLYQRHEVLRGRIDSLRTDPKFAEAISALALRAMQTSVKDRLKRLARIVVNAVRQDDLDPEGLDDMMRAAVELSESDIFLLGRIYKLQVHVIRDSTSSDSDRLKRITSDWTARTKLKTENGGIELSKCRGSVARLQAQAFVQLRTPGFDAGAEIVVLLEDGAKFYERLQEIGATK